MPPVALQTAPTPPQAVRGLLCATSVVCSRGTWSHPHTSMASVLAWRWSLPLTRPLKRVASSSRLAWKLQTQTTRRSWRRWRCLCRRRRPHLVVCCRRTHRRSYRRSVWLCSPAACPTSTPRSRTVPSARTTRLCSVEPRHLSPKHGEPRRAATTATAAAVTTLVARRRRRRTRLVVRLWIRRLAV